MKNILRATMEMAFSIASIIALVFSIPIKRMLTRMGLVMSVIRIQMEMESII